MGEDGAFEVAEELLLWPPGVLTMSQQKGSMFPKAGGEAVVAGDPAVTGSNSGDKPNLLGGMMGGSLQGG